MKIFIHLFLTILLATSFLQEEADAVDNSSSVCTARKKRGGNQSSKRIPQKKTTKSPR